jgi:hypothetical protein
MQNTSDAARVLARGTEITLKDGSTQALVFDFEAIAMLEDKYGSLDDFVAILQGKGKRFTAIKDAMVAALAHTGMAPDKIVKLLEFKQFQQYVEALGAAFAEGMPEGTADQAPLAPNLNGSLGNGSTGQLQSPSAAPIKSSSE